MSEATFLGHEECPKCGSSDNLGRWSDGHAFCFGTSCGYREPPRDGYQGSPKLKVAADLLPWRYSEDLLWKVVSPDIARRYRYGLSAEPWKAPNGKKVTVHVANYCNREGEVIAQKLRLPNKGIGYSTKSPDAAYFPWVGSPKGVMPMGYHLWKGGKRLVIVEGEKDCLAVAHILKGEWPVWSLVNGAASAARDLAKLLPDLERFEEVILLFDADEAGQAGQIKAAEALMGSVNVKLAAPLPLKDATEMLIAGRGAEVLKAIWNAQRYTPESIVTGREVVGRLKERLRSGTLKGTPYPWEGLNQKLQGARPGEIVTLTAGSGTGKSTVCRTLMRHFHLTTGLDQKVGGCFLEEDTDETLAGILSMGIEKNILVRSEEVTEAELDGEADRLFAEKDLYLFDMKDEALTTEAILTQLRYMAKGLGCRYIFLDHLSFIVGGMEIADERKAIDVAMTKLRRLVKALGITLFLVVHLKRPDGNKGYDEGLKVSTNFIRGSQAIEQISNIVIALQRNKREAAIANKLEVVLLKNRFSGDDGCTACWLDYDRDAGTLTECEAPSALASYAEEDGFDAGEGDDPPWNT